MNSTGRGLTELSAGSRVVLAGTWWQVRELEPHTGRVLLRRDGGQELATTIRALVNRSDCRAAPAAVAGLPHGPGRQPAGLEDLTVRQRELVASRYAHLMEAETGYRSGSPLHALPGEPWPGYDPAVTTLHQRRLAKVAEMAALETPGCSAAPPSAQSRYPLAARLPRPPPSSASTTATSKHPPDQQRSPTTRHSSALQCTPSHGSSAPPRT